MRINKYLAESGVCSRRAADNLIAEGVVKKNGKVCSVGEDVDIVNDKITVNGKPVSIVKNFEYYVMNKPKGYVCTVKDDKDRKTVMDLLPKNITRVYPVGRLDYDSEGLLIFTNDGDLAYKLTHPKNEIPKTYLVKTEKPVSDKDVAALRAGVTVDGVRTKKCNVTLIETNKTGSKLHVTITEGRNRQVRKMFEAVGNSVDFLKRIKIGDLKLTGLNRGETRKLTPAEINYLLYL
ncbi:MAG: pseudouridine synthase [Candidatus Borkfalkiaceae bacterium]|nr:pseudouridine synthase [Christensenellaceae bacterium]